MIAIAPSPQPPARPCFTCRHFGGMLDPSRSACSNPKCSAVQARPNHGCSAHEANPDEDPWLLTLELWSSKYGTPIYGLTQSWSEEQRFPPPLVPAEIARLHEAAKGKSASRLTAPMARELGRLHDLLYRTVYFLDYVAQWVEAGQQVREDARRAAEIIRREPGVQLLIERAEAETRNWRR